jgi:tryptophan-rich sensory protein
MGVAAWLVWRKHGFRDARTALWLFIAQLVANALWTWLFFVLQRGAADCGNHLRVLAFAPARRTVAGPISCLGKFRVDAYLVAVAAESFGSWLTYAVA